MKILITGHKGYLGREFIKRYGKKFEIIGYDLQEGDDLLDYKKLLKKINGCQQVVHLAGVPSPVLSKTFEEYFDNNVKATLNVAKAAVEKGLKRIIYASSTTIYGIERGIPFKIPIKEDQKFVSQYIPADRLSCREVDLSYHISKVMAEQIIAWHGLNKKIQTIALRLGPINKVFLGTSLSIHNATEAIRLAIDYSGKLWYEAFSIVDELSHIDISKAKKILGYKPEKAKYTKEQIRSTLEERAK